MFRPRVGSKKCLPSLVPETVNFNSEVTRLVCRGDFINSILISILDAAVMSNDVQFLPYLQTCFAHIL
jgi:hypothetical protein